MRALTLMFSHSHCARFTSCNNEVLAREGIDTHRTVAFGYFFNSNNEVLAREGIDTIFLLRNCFHIYASSNNEVLASEGIDTLETGITYVSNKRCRNEA